MRRLAMIAIAVLPVCGGSAAAKDEPAPETPAIYRELIDCRAIADPAARLECFDRRVAALDSAMQSRDLVIADKQQVRAARRGLFGFAAPLGRLLGIGGGDDEADADDGVKRLETTVSEVRRTRDGALKLVFAEGGTWEQIDTRSFALTPRVGNKAVIVRGALGSYIVSVDGMPGIKFRRVE
jgi:hypothetical protein